MRGASRIPARGTLLGIQYLRGVAAMLIVLFHLAPQLERMGYRGVWPRGLAGGVDLFFVISGFVMWMTTADRAIGPLSFWRRRIARIVPLYWLATTFMVIATLAAPSVLRSTRFDAAHVVASYLFVPWDHPVLHQPWPILTPGWTLDYEVAFYLLFGLCLLARVRLRFWTIIVALSLLTAIGWFATPGALLPRFYTNDVMLEFAGGIALAAFMRRLRFERMPLAASWGLVAAGLGCLLVIPECVASPSRFLTMGVGAIGAVAGVLAIEARGGLRANAALRLLGDASYSLYLSQQITIAAAAVLWRRLGLAEGPLGWALFCPFALLVATSGGLSLYLGVEHRLVRSLRPRAIRPSSASTTSPIAAPHITVVTTNYNYGHLLADTIRSVRDQDYRHVDHIVVDDGSTDDSLAVARGFPGVRVIARPNGGQVSAAQAALPYITGDLVVFLDSDDTLYPGACATIAAQYETGVVLYQFGLDIVDGEGRRLRGYPDQPLLAEGHAAFVLRHGYFPASPTSGNAFATAHVRQMLALAGDDLRYFVDGYLIYSAPFFGRVKPSAAVIGRYLVHGANVSLSAGISARSAERSLRNALWQRGGIVTALRLQGRDGGRAADHLDAWHLRHLLVLRRCYGVRDIAPDLSDRAAARRAARKFLTYPGLSLRQRAQNLLLLAALLAGDRRLGRRVVPAVARPPTE